ncbi:MAG: DUF89 family protein [Bacteroidia bacterium]|nr:ARMT1-like domain-containing protein [Bacteroidales bacterium]NCD40786.1 DUF89 family protein [Bacteroidia bacterium]
MDIRCIDCFQASFARLLEKYSLSDEQKMEFWHYFDETTPACSRFSAPEMQVILQKKLKTISGIEDFYLREKCDSNNLALSIADYWKEAVKSTKNPFAMAVRLAIAGNIMDYGAANTFNLRKTIEKVMHAKLGIDCSNALADRVQSARKILYLGDNAGEIVFDKLLIATMQHPDLTFVTRGGPTLNDVTLKDAHEVRMQDVAQVISSGLDAPTTLLSQSSQSFRDHFQAADLIISKGQGNLEGLIDLKDPRIYFLLMAKCRVMAERLGVEVNDFVIYNAATNHVKSSC